MKAKLYTFGLRLMSKKGMTSQWGRIPFILLVIPLFSYQTLVAQCTETGPNDPGNAEINISIGTVIWLDVGGVLQANDGLSSTAVATLSGVSQYIVAEDFGFSIPDNAIICGITAEILKGAVGTVEDESVRIAKGGTFVGDDKALSGNWPLSQSYFTYGGSDDLWGTTWTPEEINASDFGVGISADLSALSTAEIDHIRVSVSYEMLLPIELIDFDARCHDDGVAVTWEVASQSDNASFELQRSIDGFEFETIAKVPGAGNSSELLDYSHWDPDLSPAAYYRLRQTDFDGSYTLSHLIQVECPATQGPRFYPNPVHDYLVIDRIDPEVEWAQLIIYDNQGRVMMKSRHTSSESFHVDVIHLAPGMYFHQIISHGQIRQRGKWIKK